MQLKNIFNTFTYIYISNFLKISLNPKFCGVKS